MNRYLRGGMGALLAAASVISAVPASAQYRDHDRDGVPDRYDRHDDRRDWRNSDRRWDRREWRDQRGTNWRYYGGRYGDDGYRGAWREGQRYPYWRDNRYAIYNYRAYDLPPPRPGYRYYRDRNGDIVMAAVATGIIGLIVGSALADGGHHRW